MEKLVQKINYLVIHPHVQQIRHHMVMIGKVADRTEDDDLTRRFSALEAALTEFELFISSENIRLVGEEAKAAPSFYG